MSYYTKDRERVDSATRELYRSLRLIKSGNFTIAAKRILEAADSIDRSERSRRQYVVAEIVDGKPSNLANFDLHDKSEAEYLAAAYHEWDVYNRPDKAPREYAAIPLDVRL